MYGVGWGVGQGLWVEVGLCVWGVVVVLLVGVGLCVWDGVGAGVCVHRCKVRFCHAVVSHMVTALSPPFLPSFSF